MIHYRNLAQTEAQSFWNMMNLLDSETEFMMYEPGEREQTAYALSAIKELITNAANGSDFLMIAEEDGEIAGYLLAERGKPRRVRHSAYIVVGVRKGYRGKGIGRELFRRLEIWARESQVTRLELTVMCTNSIAKQLYEKNGFEVEGIKRNSMQVNGRYVDEYYMAKLR